MGLDDLDAGSLDRGPGPLLGLSDAGAPVHLGPRAGHIMVVAWPGLGATTALRSLAAQYTRRGADVDILDVADQHTWARGQPRVQRYADAASVHRHLHHLAEQVRAERSGAPRVVMVESDLTINALLRFGHHPPLGGTGLDTLTTVLGAGRLYGIRVVLACRAVPIPLRHTARSLFTTRLLAGPTPLTWHLLGGAGTAMPPEESFHAGRMHLVSNSTERPVQLLQLTDLEAARLASTAATSSTPPHVRRRLRGRPPALAPAASTFQIPHTRGD
ncbi:hypothetical protein [Streptomyces sp. NPDC015125]|uniref:hypothetical protein n=1 Tax=Streptomyces sp. NPDC015125 TaxID=3364938 RepID=UPI0036F68B25